jgi:hypothetical protein
VEAGGRFKDLYFSMAPAKNKTLTRSNLAKRKDLVDMSSLFYNGQETVNHLFL